MMNAEKQHPMLVKKYKRKLTVEQVIEIRRKYAAENKMTAEKLAKEYGVGRSTIDSVRKRETWKFVD